MTAPDRPTVRVRRLANALRTLRTDQGLSRKEVFERTGVNTATLYRIEAARVRPQARTLTALLTLYQVTEDQRRTMTELMSKSDQAAWLHAYTDVLSETAYTAIEYETEAHTLHTYSALCVPDLLQTPAYAHAVNLSRLPAADQHTAERPVTVRTRRQAALTNQHGPLHLRAVCDEAVLHRLVGGPDVMRDQLRHLTEMAALPNVTVQLIPFRAGAHPGTLASFTVMDLHDDTRAVHLQDAATGDRILTTPTDTRHCAHLFTHTQQTALPPAESMELTAAPARQVTGPKQNHHWAAPT